MVFWIQKLLFFLLFLNLDIIVDSQYNEGLYKYTEALNGPIKEHDREKRHFTIWKQIKENANTIYYNVAHKRIKQNKQTYPYNNSAQEQKKQEKNGTKDIGEHGNLDSLGRDVIRTITNTIKKVEEKFFKSDHSTGLDTNSSHYSGLSNIFDQMKAIYPGTKWCGDGNRARGFSDLGRYEKVDICCRDHDNCPVSIPAGQSEFGLKNTGLFTRSHCDCDRKFYDCLKSSNHSAGKSIGVTYFTVLGPQCFKKSKPTIECNEYNSKRCLNYKFDDNTDKEIYQWFDNPTF